MSPLEAQLEACEAQVAALQACLSSAQRDLSREQERASLLRRLVQLETPEGSPNVAATARESSATRRKRATGSPMRLEDAVVAILKEKDEAVHIGHIRAALVERGISIPGKGTDSNIIARLIRHPLVTREVGRRGFYRLSTK
jgi:hypothetical protein